jgi:predicted nucleic acid-binding protein
VTIDALVDSSVAVKWLDAKGEDEVEAANSLLRAEAESRIRLLVAELVFYEVGNALVRCRGWPGRKAGDGLEDLESICPDVVPLTRWLRTDAAIRAARHGLSYYDAVHWATAESIGATLVTADRQLLDLDAGISPTEMAGRLSD